MSQNFVKFTGLDLIPLPCTSQSKIWHGGVNLWSFVLSCSVIAEVKGYSCYRIKYTLNHGLSHFVAINVFVCSWWICR